MTEILITDEKLFPVNQEQYIHSSAESLSLPTGNSTEVDIVLNSYMVTWYTIGVLSLSFRTWL